MYIIKEIRELVLEPMGKTLLVISSMLTGCLGVLLATLAIIATVILALVTFGWVIKLLTGL